MTSRCSPLFALFALAACQGVGSGFQEVERTVPPLEPSLGLSPVAVLATADDHRVREVTELVPLGDLALSCGNKWAFGIWDLGERGRIRLLSVVYGDDLTRCDSVAVSPDEGTAWVAQRGTSNGPGNVVAVDIGNPAAPRVLATHWLPHEIAAVAAMGDGIWVAAGGEGLRSYVAGPEGALTPAGDLGFLGVASGLVVDPDGRWLYVLSRDQGIFVVDPADPSAPRVVAHLELPGVPHAMAIDGGQAWVALGAAGVAVLSLSPSWSPALASVLDTPGTAIDVAALPEAGAVAIADWQSVRLLDAREPGFLRPVARAPLGAIDPDADELPDQRAFSVAAGPDGQLLAGTWGELRTYDVDVDAQAGDLSAAPGVARLPHPRDGESATTVRVTNIGSLPVHITEFLAEGGLTVSGPALPLDLLPADGITVRVSAPTGVSAAHGVLTVVSDDLDEPLLTVPVYGEGEGWGPGDAPQLTFATTSGEALPLRDEGDDHAILLDYFTTF